MPASLRQAQRQMWYQQPLQHQHRTAVAAMPLRLQRRQCQHMIPTGSLLPAHDMHVAHAALRAPAMMRNTSRRAVFITKMEGLSACACCTSYTGALPGACCTHTAGMCTLQSRGHMEACLALMSQGATVCQPCGMVCPNVEAMRDTHCPGRPHQSRVAWLSCGTPLSHLIRIQ